LKNDWHKEDIKAALRKGGLSFARLSRETDYARQSFSVALSRPFPQVEKIIAGALGLHPQEIWPSRYCKNGEPKVARATRKNITRQARVYVQRAMGR